MLGIFYIMKKSFLVKILIPLFLFCGATNVLAVDYTLLEPGVFEQNSVKVGTGDSFMTYAKMAFKALLSIAVALAILQIVLGGFGYVTGATMGEKGDGKEKIWDALKGLAIILLSWLILYTINPDLVNWKFRVDSLGENNTLTSPATPPLS